VRVVHASTRFTDLSAQHVQSQLQARRQVNLKDHEPTTAPVSDGTSVSSVLELTRCFCSSRGLSEADIRAEIGRQGRESLKRRPEKCVAPKKTALDATATVFKPKTSG
jgi:hypothetical protein